MRKLHHSGRRLTGAIAATGTAGAMIAGSLALSGTLSGTALAAKTTAAHVARHHHAGSNSCHLAHGIKHIVQIAWDNIHYYRDNPNVPSDLEMMPNLLNFIEDDGTMLTNSHTPLIAHTGDDLLTTATGLYGDRHGDPIANSYRSYNADGTTSLSSVFSYWTGAIPNGTAAGRDTNPNMVYSPVPPATASTPITPDTVTPAPWVPFTKAGCNFGEVATQNTDLENATPDIANLFGPNSPEAQQLAADPDSFKDAEAADYEGLAVHCAKHNTFCSSAAAVKFGQTTPTSTEVPDLLPQQPGGYHGFDELLGHRYIAPQIGAGTANLMRNGFQVTNSSGNLVDLDGNEIDGGFLTNHPGFPGFGPINAAQSLAYGADMLESGVPVVQLYMADVHGNESITGLSGPGQPCFHAPAALGSGSACYVAQAQYYNDAFGKFFRRLAADGITAKNTLFVLSSDEGDHEAGANAGRAIQPTPANCDGATVSGDTVTPDVLCTYPAGSFGELAGNMTGLLTAAGNTTPFALENDTAPEFYVTGNPGPLAPAVRSLEHLTAGLTADNPYTGTNQPITNFLADPTEEAILHMVNADPARTPTFAMFAKPDYFLSTSNVTSCGSTCVTQTTGFAWDHGDYAAEIDTNFIGIAGPGVKHLGLDGNEPGDGPNSAGPDSGQTEVVQTHLKGPWTDEADIRPTILYLAGLKDNYIHDGRVITQVVANPNRALRQPGANFLGECYKQLNSSVGKFGAFTLAADTAAVESSSAGDSTFVNTDTALRGLEVARDRLAIRIKDSLDRAAFSDRRIRHLDQDIVGCLTIIHRAHKLMEDLG
ncbi:MAG TPA: hypothetical protein VFQ44_22280 [Streptosporangiaceae bacterium]|nr:hypothetical protein [Streptosporangiaceae bacterium]